MIKLYSYKNCGTCKKAIKFLNDNSISYKLIPIRDTPPSLNELKLMLSKYNDIKYLFNTSGVDYRALNLKDKRNTMSVDDQLELLVSNGNLIKRPFLISETVQLVGFKQADWNELI